MLEMDEKELDNMLNEHDWASDHISTSKDDVEEVFNFFAGNKEEKPLLNEPESHDISFNDEPSFEETEGNLANKDLEEEILKFNSYKK